MKGKKDSNLISIFSILAMEINDLIKTLLIILPVYVVYIKLTNNNVGVIKNVFIGAIYIAIFTTISLIMALLFDEPYKSGLLIFLSSIFFFLLFKKKFSETFFFMIVSFAISFLTLIISSIISTAILTIIYEINDVDVRILVLALILEIIFILVICKINFKIILENKKGFGGAGVALSGIALVMHGIFREGELSIRVYWFLVVGIFLCIFGLFCWIKRESLAAYSEKVHLKINSKLRAENEQLNEVRLYLEKIVHNDSKKLPAYQGVVESLIESTENLGMKEKAAQVLAEILNAREEYSERVSRELREKKALPSTGLELLDAIFTHYQKICAEKEIDFDLIVRGTPSLIKQSELETLVANLLDNAIIACQNSSQTDKSIVVNLSNSGLSVMDSGIAFEPETLKLLGKQRITTRANSGGSGIGFMTVFEIVRACKASVVITGNESFKTVAVWFDGKDEYRVETEETLRL